MEVQQLQNYFGDLQEAADTLSDSTIPFPDKIPDFIFDSHSNNFGWIGDKFVCHDYGQLYGLLDFRKKMKKFIL